MLAFGVRNVSEQCAHRSGDRRRDRAFADKQPRRIDPGQDPSCGRFDIAFDAGHLAGEKQRWTAAPLQRGLEVQRSVDKGVAVHDLAQFLNDSYLVVALFFRSIDFSRSLTDKPLQFQIQKYL